MLSPVLYLIWYKSSGNTSIVSIDQRIFWYEKSFASALSILLAQEKKFLIITINDNIKSVFTARISAYYNQKIKICGILFTINRTTN
jgi:hypothetical protein